MNKFFSIGLLLGVVLFFNSCFNGSRRLNIEVKDFEIICEQALLDSIYINYSEEIYIPVKFIKKSDTVDAKMRLRGDTSKEYGKKSLKVVFEKDAIPEGESKKINMNSEWTDKSYIRQYLSAYLMQQAGVYTFHTNFVKLKLNGKFWGIYLQVENMDKAFLKRNKLDTKGNLYKATKDGACLSHFDDIKVKFEKKTNKKDDWDDLQQLINELDTISVFNYKNYLIKTFEYDRLISLIAMNMLLQNGSTYYHNYYLFHDINGNGKWQLMPWDMDKTMSFYNYKPYKYHETSSNWESDNPLIEKAFLNQDVLKDIKQKVKELGKKYFNSKKINPIIDACEDALIDVVKNDNTDQIENVDTWKRALKSEQKYIDNQVEVIINQLTEFPKSFMLEQLKTVHPNNIILKWHASASSSPITYRVLYGTHFLLEDETTKTIQGITDTVCCLNNIKPGQYYWRVYASDGKNETEGFNTKSTFEVSVEEKKQITSDTLLLKKNNPHIVNSTWVINEGATLRIEPGCKLLLTNNATIENHGILIALGTVDDSIFITPQADSWNAISNHGSESFLKMAYCHISDGFLHSFSSNVTLQHCTYRVINKNLIANGERASIIWVSRGTFNMDSCYLKNDKKSTGEGMNIHYAETSITNSVFDNMADAIEIINVSYGEIHGNIVMNSPDDAIDMNGCSNINITDNIFINNYDKAVSAGTEQFGPSNNINIENNFMISNGMGLSVKDSSFCSIKNCTLVGNKTALNAYLKNNWKKYTLGGNIQATGLLFSENKKVVTLGEASVINIANSVFDANLHDGEGNKVLKVDFKDAKHMNFNSDNEIGASINIELIEKLNSLLK